MQKIRTQFVDPPIPTGFEWVASYDSDEPDDEGRMACGHGPTEQAAIDDLLANHPRDEDPLRAFWACLSCGTKNEFGAMLAADVMRCPKCRSDAIEPGDGRTVTVEDSQWAVPAVTN